MTDHRRRLHAPALPDHDPGDPAESAVIAGLTRSWPRRAAVKKPEVDLDALFEPHRTDFPEAMLPFAEHRRFLALDEDRQARLRAWAWIAYNKSVVDIEQYVVNPGFGLITADVFGLGLSDTVITGVLQAMVDEQYHTLMHQQANALTRRRRGWALPETVLPPCPTVRAHRLAVARAADPRAAALVQLAFTTVAETSISAYLALLTGDAALQPVHRATVAVHRRDELCHSSLAGELLTAVLTDLDDTDRVRLLDALGVAVAAFTGSDTGTWAAILEHEDVPGRAELVDDTIAATADRPVVQDCTAIRRLCGALGLGDELDARWPWPR
ncbi:AurF N-oxygenase family protein [Rhodococcus sp. CH91]|uniref:AurF N-oxygenase family protein n=1 Tax=Rhodococcus sp. CH91 TaxID=2910256 RepID=UPI001F4AD187|nr:diiron oxygenase [Rhodococcus sp. CH91]